MRSIKEIQDIIDNYSETLSDMEILNIIEIVEKKRLFYVF